jgi:hypothetical protein
MTSTADESVTYRDGVGLLRCATCRRALRDADEGPLVAVREADLEAVLRVLLTAGDAGLVTRFRQALGRNVQQLEEARHGTESAPAATGDV